MEFKEEFITEHGFTPEQVAAITGQITPHIAELKNGWDGKANEQAEGIIQGAIDKTQKDTGYKLERLESEKNAEYLARFNLSYLSSQKTDLEQSKLDYDTKMKDFKGDETLKGDYDKLVLTHSELQQKEAEFAKIMESGIVDAHEKLLIEHEGMKLNTAFSNVKPVFSQDSNEFEVAAKWDGFKRDVLSKYTIEIVDGEAIAVDKENKYTTVKLKDLVDKEDALTLLVKGRQQKGVDGKVTDLKDVEGVPFKVPAIGGDLTSEVQKYLASQGVGNLDPDYSKKFSEYYNKAKAAQQKTAQTN